MYKYNYAAIATQLHITCTKNHVYGCLFIAFISYSNYLSGKAP